MFSSLTDPNLAHSLKQGGIAVIPTDTLYGIVARASDEAAVERIYKLRGRAPDKPCIILAAGIWQITDMSLWTDMHHALAGKYWPGPLSLVAPVAKTEAYLHRGTHTLAYRVPDRADLRKLLALSGPLVAPSANTQGNPPATTIAEAYAYFGDRIDGYVDGGMLDGAAPSTVAAVQDGAVRVLRQGVLRLIEL